MCKCGIGLRPFENSHRFYGNEQMRLIFNFSVLTEMIIYMCKFDNGYKSCKMLCF